MVRPITAWLGNAHAFRLLLGLHLLLLAMLFAKHGIADDKEALKYLGAAKDMLQCDTDDLLVRYRLYSGYVFFLMPFAAVGMPELAVLMQVFLGLLAARAIERMVIHSGSEAWVGRTAAALYLLSYPVQQWVLSFYSEGLFIPLTVLFMERAFRDRLWSPSLVLLACMVLITRPTGALFVAPVLLLRCGAGPLRWVAIIGLALIMLFAPVLPRDQLQGMVQQHVVLGFPERPDATLSPSVRSLADIQATVLADRGPVGWTCLVGRRIGSLFNPTRPWFSIAHNALVAPLIALYPLALWGLWRDKRDTHKTLATVLALNILLVGLTYDEWGGRFLAPLLPVVILLAAAAMAPKRHIPSGLHSPSASKLKLDHHEDDCSKRRARTKP